MSDQIASERFVGLRGVQYQANRAGRSFSRTYQARMYFQPYTTDRDTVLDFGSNDGLFLRCLPAGRRIGVEVNLAARDECTRASEETGVPIEQHETLATVESDSVDVVISNHALEHTLRPFDILSEIRRVLKPGCCLVMVTPFDDWRNHIHRIWVPGDSDNHLYTWSPRNMGNLLTEVGFEVQEARFCQIAVTQRLKPVRIILGDRVFRACCRLFGRHKKKGELFVRALKPRQVSVRTPHELHSSGDS